ncbi:hypothetical protein [Agromyces sp. NPDC058104]|uniref:hypothetical protein n=1 Tax=Agromyces sp. NPDC058104 TaxID=3346342 RepID=UPI0036DCA765
MTRKTSGAILCAALLLLAGVLQTGVQPAAAAESEGGAPSPELYVTVPFAHPVALDQAIKTTRVDGSDVLSYRFENPEVVGEYSPASQTPAEFLALFREQFGTDPQIAAVVIQRPNIGDIAQSTARAHRPIPTDAPEFRAAPVAIDSIANIESRNRSWHDAGKAPAPRKAEATLASTRWDPDQADIQIFRPNQGSVLFQQYYAWVSLATSPNRVPAHWGLEFEVNIYTNQQTGATRPWCSGAYREDPFAKNYQWTWWVSVAGPNGNLAPGAADLGAYADYNDSLDPCNRNSMAIGLANPRAIPIWSGQTVYQLNAVIVAPRGEDETGRIGGNVQAVTTTRCEDLPSMSLTDCMGVVTGVWPGPGDRNRATLSESRNWIAPSKCWLSLNYGSTAPQPYQC